MQEEKNRKFPLGNTLLYISLLSVVLIASFSSSAILNNLFAICNSRLLPTNQIVNCDGRVRPIQGNQDIPVLVMTEEGEAVLLIGFNEMNTVIMNPATGTVYKMGMNDSKDWFEKNGNRFITYVRMEQ